MARILLVSGNTSRIPYPVPPAGLCLLASVLESQAEVRIFDPLNERGEDVAEVAADFNPDYIGLGIRNVDDVTMDGGAYFIDDLKKDLLAPLRRATDAPLILGGSGFSIFPAELMKEMEADYGLVGEAEASLPALISCLESGRRPGGIPGLILSQDAAPLPRSDNYVDLDALPTADIDRWLDFAPYRQRGSYTIQTKRGCRHRCLYCSYPRLEGGCFRRRSPAAVADEIRQVSHRLGDVTFEFADSTFNDPPGHAEAVCREIIRRGLNVRLRTMGVNPAYVTFELLDLMTAAGFAQIDVTPDSASPVMMANLGKNFGPDDLTRAAGIIATHGMPTMWFFLFGGPGETQGTIRETFDFIDRFVAAEDMAHLSEGLRVYPATPLYDAALEEGVIKEGQPLLRPVFYVSPGLGRDKLLEAVKQLAGERDNCVRSAASTPPPDMLQEAVRLRREQGITEPMFRTLLRLRRRGFGGGRPGA